MTATVLQGDCRERLATLAAESVQCVVTSPPYFNLRDYNVPGQIGLEPTVEAYVEALVEVFRQVWRVLRSDGTVWLNLGDSYASSPVGSFNGGSIILAGRELSGHAYKSRVNKARLPGLKPKDLIGIPWRVAFALQADGWWLRSDIIWSKPNCMPESVTDRPTRSHEYVFLLSKSERYFYDAEAVKEPAINGDPTSPRGSEGVSGMLNSGRRKQDAVGSRLYTGFNARWDMRVEPLTGRNKRSVWTVVTSPYAEAHFATFPPKMIEPCILAGSRPGDTVLDPFGGAGTTALVAERHNRDSIVIELNPAYCELIERRLAAVQPTLLDLPARAAGREEGA